jgi:hypothetical protein
LKKFELKTKPARSETEVAGVNRDDWRAPDIRPYDRLATRDLLRRYDVGHLESRHLAIAVS